MCFLYIAHISTGFSDLSNKKTGKKSEDSIHDHSQSHGNLPKKVTIFSHCDERFSIAERFPKISILQPIILIESFSSLQPLLWDSDVLLCFGAILAWKKTSWSASSLQKPRQSWQRWLVKLHPIWSWKLAKMVRQFALHFSHYKPPVLWVDQTLVFQNPPVIPNVRIGVKGTPKGRTSGDVCGSKHRSSQGIWKTREKLFVFVFYLWCLC